MDTRPSRDRGFTIVEMLVVIGIISLLLAVLVPALSGVKKRSLKFQETNSLREISKAWHLYANAFNGSALPGYLDPNMQGALPGWNVEFEYGNPAPGQSNLVIPPTIAAPWTWRLLPYLDYNHQVVHGHLDEPAIDQTNMTVEATEIALEPGFGYNGYYLGGWWEMVTIEDEGGDIGGDVDVPRYKYFKARADLNDDGSIGEDEMARVVVRTISQIRRSTDVVVFCSSSEVVPGVYKRWHNDQPGSHIVVPPWLADVRQWGLPNNGGGGGPGDLLGTEMAPSVGGIWTIEAFVDTSPPIGRYTKSSAVVYADGHTANDSARDLMDMRNWIDIANKRDFQHLPDR